MHFVDLFAGPGGLDLGAHHTGATTTGIERDLGAVATRMAAGLPTLLGDVRDYSPADVPQAEGLAGGPPCQTFSGAGTGTGRAQLDRLAAAVRRFAAEGRVRPLAGIDERTGLVLEPLRWLLAAERAGRPYRALVLEQVPAVLPIWQAYAETLAARGWHAAYGVLRTEQYGVPQTRRRAVLVASTDGPVALPAPTHRAYRRGVHRGARDAGLLPWVAMADVLPDRGPFTVVSNYGTGGDPRARGRRTSDEPAFTVTGKISRLRLVAPDGRELPRLSAAEAGLLQGFPADWPWTGRDIPQQIGNACPPTLAAALVRAATAARTAAADRIVGTICDLVRRASQTTQDAFTLASGGPGPSTAEGAGA
ncbi:DNA cytosine methyltransferase [Streptomyces sp. A1136]|uniref:DNA cytosine methyltransferase n=1 Tax=Streptomyces sp. A1136 TaxID=2563102 RepID=UPI00109E9677|nr:DNA cytosine methyltransferase [Streptomyces sp. A1136]THA56128.1 DNA cytosine methyltransferase [Streptomyces sp. A1136]